MMKTISYQMKFNWLAFCAFIPLYEHIESCLYYPEQQNDKFGGKKSIELGVIADKTVI